MARTRNLMTTDRPAAERGVDISVERQLPASDPPSRSVVPGVRGDTRPIRKRKMTTGRPRTSVGRNPGLQVNRPGTVMPRRLHMVGKMIISRRPDRRLSVCAVLCSQAAVRVVPCAAPAVHQPTPVRPVAGRTDGQSSHERHSPPPGSIRWLCPTDARVDVCRLFCCGIGGCTAA